MKHKPAWFEPDKSALLDHAASLSLKIEEFKSEEEDGAFVAQDKIIFIESGVEEVASIYISTLLHELGHYYEIFLRNLPDGSGDVVTTLFGEYLAGICGYYLHRNLKLDMPLRYYYKSNQDNLWGYLSEIYKEAGSDRGYSTVIRDTRRIIRKIEPEIRETFKVKSIPGTLIQFFTVAQIKHIIAKKGY